MHTEKSCSYLMIHQSFLHFSETVNTEKELNYRKSLKVTESKDENGGLDDGVKLKSIYLLQQVEPGLQIEGILLLHLSS